MAEPSPSNALGGGAPIALCVMAGAGIGFVLRQPTIGLLAGAALGTAIALALWWRESRRDG